MSIFNVSRMCTNTALTNWKTINRKAQKSAIKNARNLETRYKVSFPVKN